MNISERIDSLFMNNPLHEAGVFEHEHYDPEDPERKKWSAPEPKTEAELQKDAYDKQQKEMQDRWDAEEKAKAEEKELNKKKEEEEKKEQDELWAKEETERIKANREGLLNILTEFNNRGYDLNKYSKIYFIDKNNKKCRSLVADKIIFRPDAELPTDLKATNPLFSKGPGYKDIVTVSNKNELDSLGKEEDILYRVVDTKINYVYENGQLKVKNILPIKKVSLAEIKEVYCGDKDNKGSIKFELGPRGDHIVEFNFSSEDINSIYDKKYLSAAEDAIAKNAIEKDKKKFEVIEKKNEERIISAINVARNTYRHFPADLVTVENHVLKIKNGTEIKAYRTLQTYEIKFFAYEWVDDVSILKLRRYPYNFFENRPTASSNDETICIGYVRRKEQTPPADREGPKIPERKYEGEAIRFYSQAEHFPSKVDFPYRGRPGHMYVDDATGQKYIYDILSPTTKEKQAVWGFELTNEEEGWPKNPQLKTLYINESETGQFNKGQGYLWNAEQGFYKYDRPEKKQGTWDDKVRYPSINDFPGNAKIELNPEKYASKESYEKALEWARITDKEKRSNRVLYIDDSTGRGYIWDETRKATTTNILNNNCPFIVVYLV